MTRPVRRAVAVDVSSTDQTFDRPTDCIHVGHSAAVTMVVRLSGDAADTTWSLTPGWHPLAVSIVRKSGTTVTATKACWA